MDFQKTNVGTRIKIFEILFVPIVMQTDNFYFFDPNLPKTGFWDRIFEILSLNSESASPIYHERQFSGKTDIFEFLAQICPKKDFWVGASKK